MQTGCRYGICPRAAVYRGYCDRHKHLAERGRAPSSQRGYGGDWPRIRANKLNRDPLCEFSNNGTVCRKPATDVHHIVTVKEALAAGWPWPRIHADSNLRSGCHECHSRETAISQSRWSKAAR